MMSMPALEALPERFYGKGVLTQALCLALGGELLQALKASDTVIVNFDGVEDLDISCLVLLCAVKRQASEMGKELLFEGLKNPLVAALVQSYCNNGSRICRSYCGHSCLFEAEI